AAAAAVVAFVVTSRGPAASTQERLEVAAKALASEDPADFEGFRALSSDERRRVESAATRGEIAALLPAGRVDEGRPDFRWTAVPAAREYAVSLVGPDGKTLWKRTTTKPSLPYPQDAPALAPGSYVWEVVASGPAGSATGRRAFEAAAPELARRAAAAT